MVLYSDGFMRGLQACLDMLKTLGMKDCAISRVSNNVREGRPQDNAVRRTLEEILSRGDAVELDGFCAGLTDIVSSANEYGDYSYSLGILAERRSGPA